MIGPTRCKDVGEAFLCPNPYVAGVEGIPPAPWSMLANWKGNRRSILAKGASPFKTLMV